MSDQKSDQEPSVEEILASIRRIISEDETEEDQPAEDAPSVIEEDAEPLIAEAAAPDLALEDEVFELTQEVRDDGTVVDIATGETIHGDEALKLVEIDEFDQLMAEATTPTAPVAAAPLSIEPEVKLVGPPASAASTASFESLAQSMAGKRAESGIGGLTVEEVVKEIVRPIIKDWLDENLPDLVERLVSREIGRMTRRAEDTVDS